ncbi:tetratricopeptide repeat protein [Bombella sp. TMW 2.2559]|uniref:Tetratricopeptide repeat protein n=1 Tax=Bombella dulcis TaxID=2967339 RepID=A0ABT3WBY1_9PROT|nr:tetratricopeptide repeat protein [Bombella dulcis]MCX5616595.1 tetratricopeptide repeat protein [Bombella dulcis]
MTDALFLASTPSHALEINQSSFMKQVIEASREVPVLVEFWAASSASNQQLSPVLEKVVRTTEGRVRLTRLDIAANRSLVAQLVQAGLPLQSVPTVVAFWKGQVRDLFQGAQSENDIKTFVEQLLKDSGQAMPVAEQLKTAEAAFRAGELAEAINIYASVLEAEPRNPTGWAGLIRCMVAMNDPEGAEEAASQIPEAIAGHDQITSALAALKLHQEGREAAGKIDDIRQKLEQAPHDTSLLEDLAKAQNGAGDREAAAQTLLDIIARDKDGAGQSARAELLKFFEAWGMTDHATLAARRRLSSLLFS